MTKLGQFIREVKQEGLKVTWPSRKETTTTTIMVFIMVFIVALFLFFADFVIAEAVQFILGVGK